MTVLLHGFWGAPQDWNKVIERLPLGTQVYAPDLFEAGVLSPMHSYTQWSANFWNWVDHQFGAEPIQLVGYSMGARLAVGAAIRSPARVRRALFLSCNPLWAKEDFTDREAWENRWAEDFLNLGWPDLESRWQEQPVFSGSPALARRNTPELREVLGLALKNWSPRLHPFAAAEVQALPSSMEWAFGALDQKYAKVAKSLQELPVQGQISSIAQAGHRLPAEAADFISQWIAKG